MFRIFKAAVPLLTLVMAIAASAFVGEPSAKQVDKATTLKFWKLVDLNNPQDPQSYIEITNPNDYEDIDCSGSQTVCKMQAQDDGTGHPQFIDQNQDNLPDVDGTLVTERFLRDK